MLRYLNTIYVYKKTEIHRILVKTFLNLIIGPSEVRVLPLGVRRQNVVTILNGHFYFSLFFFLLSPLLFYQKEGRKDSEILHGFPKSQKYLLPPSNMILR